MAQYRQSGGGYSNGSGLRNGVASSDHVAVGIRPTGLHKNQQSRHGLHHHNRRLKQPRKISTVGAVIFVLFCLFVASVAAFLYLSSQHKDATGNPIKDDGVESDTDFLINVTRTEKKKVLKFGHGPIKHGRDSRYWDRDDRRRDVDYNEEELERTRDDHSNKGQASMKGKNIEGKTSSSESHKWSNRKKNGLYNEAGRNELKMYEAEYEASLKNLGQSHKVHSNLKSQFQDADKGGATELVSTDDEYDDGIDLEDLRSEEDDEDGNDDVDHSGAMRSQNMGGGESSAHDAGTHYLDSNQEADKDKGSIDLPIKESLRTSQHSKIYSNPRESLIDSQSARRSTSEKRSGSKKKQKRRSCEMKLLNSSALIVEPLESRKFARFSLQYTEIEEKTIDDKQWVPRFAGHQSLKEREEYFIARDQKINCGFVKGPKGYASTGFDLAEDDAKYISTCHIAVVSCIFGNSDRLRAPVGKTVSRLSRKNVCFVMFVDEDTLKTLSSEGQMLDRMGFIGLWKIVVVKNLPYADMRRVGKIPKLLSHRLFTSARYSIWLDSKLRLQTDPLLLLEYFLWRKGHEYAISNHYDRHCLWEEVAQNKRLNKYNHTVIDEQFAFYQADGMKRFNASDPDKLLPSNVPEGSFIMRAHTPMSNLFSCLWFNEVDRFTPRDQLSFAYTFYKLRRMNPDKPFYLNMFKDCERRKIAKLFHHRVEERRNIPQNEAE